MSHQNFKLSNRLSIHLKNPLISTKISPWAKEYKLDIPEEERKVKRAVVVQIISYEK